MSQPQASRAAVNMSYHPHGFDSSASLQRARKPYWTRNFLTGTAIVSFIVGVYVYSISAVKQDDFSDVVDLLPPESERAHIRTIEDEARDKALGAASESTFPIAVTSSPDAPSQRLPSGSSSSASTGKGSVISQLASVGYTRLSEVKWVQAKGLVEKEKGNVIVWGAPSVDKVGGLWDAPQSKGPRRV